MGKVNQTKKKYFFIQKYIHTTTHMRNLLVSWQLIDNWIHDSLAGSVGLQDITLKLKSLIFCLCSQWTKTLTRIKIPI